MGMYLPSIKAPKQKGTKNPKERWKKYLENSFTKGTFKLFIQWEFMLWDTL